MLSPAQQFGRFKKLVTSFIYSSFLFFFLALVLATPVSAQDADNPQTPSPSSSIEHTSPLLPNADSNVPVNQHTFVQSLMIELVAASICQLAGVDIFNPDTPCLGINAQSHKIGYVSSDNQVGGILGPMSNMIATLYTPTTSTVGYVKYLADDFGIVKKTYAADDGYGFTALEPIMSMWRVTRDIAYYLLILAFIFIGIGIMLRVKIDPRTVMSIQNQIPRVVICILLITFSYAIAAIMIDLMWASTYVGVNALTSAHNPEVKNCDNTPYEKLSERGTQALLETPIIYVNDIFSTICFPGPDLEMHPMGIGSLTTHVSVSLGGMLKGLIDALFDQHGEPCLSLIPPGLNLGSCISGIIGAIGTFLLFIIIFCTILISLFRIWFSLLKAYIYIIIYIIMAPLWIVFGLLPQKPLGFEKWLRSFFANLAIFPLTVMVLVGARVLMDLFKQAEATREVQNYFVPPLTGNPFTPDFGAIIALGALLIAPQIPEVLRNALKVPNIKSQGAIAGGIAAGAAVPGAIAGAGWKHLNKRNQYGDAIGPVARATTSLGNKVLSIAGKAKVPFAKGALEKREHLQQHGMGGGLKDFKPQAQTHRENFEQLRRANPTEFNKNGYNEPKGFDKYVKDKERDDRIAKLDEKGQRLKDKGGRFAAWRAGRVDRKINRLGGRPETGGGERDTKSGEGTKEQTGGGVLKANIIEAGKVVLTGGPESLQDERRTPEEHVRDNVAPGQPAAILDTILANLQNKIQQNEILNKPISDMTNTQRAAYHTFFKEHMKDEEES